jgi:transcriptional accessory protein Tex/SPT6
LNKLHKNNNDLVNPLNELVKIAPGSLGIGMYQHDFKETVLTKRLIEVVEQCVSEVGVNVNSCSLHLLSKIAEIPSTGSRASLIIDYVKTNKCIKSRQDLLNIKGFGPISFKNSAGTFLFCWRI